MIPLYGFLEGDTIGLLVLADAEDTMVQLGERLIRSAEVRVRPRAAFRVEVRGEPTSSTTTVTNARLEALDRFDVRWEG
jgi:hypothetical protein